MTLIPNKDQLGEGSLLHRHNFVFNPKDNGGESLSLSTEFRFNGDIDENDQYYVNHTLTLQSYNNEASFHLFGIVITPATLRKLADELEKAEEKVRDELCLPEKKP